jgi:uncharacterized protein
MYGKLNTEEIEQLLGSQLIGRIGCHADGVTYVVPISYAYDGTYVYVHTYEGMKINMMRKNPKVCFQVDDTRELAYWQSVICWGEFEELKDELSKKEVLLKLHDRVLPFLSSETMHISKEWPFSAGTHENIPGVFLRIKIIEKTGRFEKLAGQQFYAT